jgi:hypothetical protein
MDAFPTAEEIAGKSEIFRIHKGTLSGIVCASLIGDASMGRRIGIKNRTRWRCFLTVGSHS